MGLIEITIFEGSQALVRDFELKRVEKSGRVVQNGDVCYVDGTHILLNSAAPTATTTVNKPILTLDSISFIDERETLERSLSLLADTDDRQPRSAIRVFGAEMKQWENLGCVFYVFINEVMDLFPDKIV